MESVLKQAAQQRFVLRKGDHAVADVAGGKHTVFATQAARASAIISLLTADTRAQKVRSSGTNPLGVKANGCENGKRGEN